MYFDNSLGTFCEVELAGGCGFTARYQQTSRCAVSCFKESEFYSKFSAEL